MPNLIMKSLTLIIISLLISQVSYGQEMSRAVDSIISGIRNYVDKIDSDKTLVRSIEEGIVLEYDRKNNPDILLDSIDAEFLLKHGGKTGGFSTYYLFNKETGQLYRIKNSKSTDIYHQLTFYYKSNQLIYAKAESGKYNGEGKYIGLLKKEIYLDNSKIISESGTGISSDELKREGQKYFKHYMLK